MADGFHFDWTALYRVDYSAGHREFDSALLDAPADGPLHDLTGDLSVVPVAAPAAD